MKNLKINLSNLLVSWFEIAKYSAFIFISLIPAIVFKSCALPGETYDAFYTIIILIMLMAADFGQASVVAYINKRALEREERRMKMGELTIICCEFCQKWFNEGGMRLEAYDYKNENHMAFCPTCGENLAEHINKMKKEIYGHKEENNED